MPAVGEKRFRVAALDLGIKTATPRHLAALGFETHVLPAGRTAEDLLAARPGRRLPLQRPGRPGRPPTTRSRRCAACSTRGSPSSASASATRSSAGRSAWAPTSCASATAASTSRCWTGSRHGAGHQPQPRLRRRRAAGPAARHPVRPGRGQPRRPQRRRRRGAALPRRPGVQRAVPPRGGRRPARRRAVRLFAEPVRRPDGRRHRSATPA